MKYLYQIFVGVVLLSFVACNGKKTQETEETGLPVFHFEQQDSDQIRLLAKDYVDRFNAGDLEGAADMLFFVRNDSVLPLSAKRRAGFLDAMKQFGQYGCVQKELKLYSDRDNELRIAVKMVEAGDFETGTGTTNLILNPVLKDGKWYLTLRDQYAEGVGLYHKE